MTIYKQKSDQATYDFQKLVNLAFMLDCHFGLGWDDKMAACQCKEMNCDMKGEL